MDLKSLQSKNIPKDLLYLLGIIFLILVVNIISHFVFFRVDLTADKRYSLSANSKEILRNLDDDLFIKVYLEGDLSVDMEKFRQSIEDQLYEFKIYGGSKISYEFVDPFKGARTDAERDTIINELRRMRLVPINDGYENTEEGLSGKTIFPSALLYYGDYIKPVNFLFSGTENTTLQDNIDHSSHMLEFNLIKAIAEMVTFPLKIAFYDREAEHMDLNFFGETVAVNRGVDGRVFGSLEEAENWLKES